MRATSGADGRDLLLEVVRVACPTEAMIAGESDRLGAGDIVEADLAHEAAHPLQPRLSPRLEPRLGVAPLRRLHIPLDQPILVPAPVPQEDDRLGGLIKDQLTNSCA